MRKTKKGIAVLLLVAILFSMNITNVFAADSSEPKVYTKETNTLTLNGDFSANGCDAAICARDNSNLTINGTGTVHGKLCGEEHDPENKPGELCGYAMAVWAKNNTKITINGGVYTNDADTVSDDKTHVDLIYASNGSEITINGGTFKCSTPKWTLNCKDKSDKTGEEVAQSVITVKGGTFYKFDPSNAEVGEGEVVVPDGYKVVQNGDWYTVIKTVYTKETNTLNIHGNLSENGCDGVIYAHDDANLTINGSGTVHGKLCGAEHDPVKNPGEFCGFAMAVWAKNNTKITINGGVYTNDADTVSDDKTHVDLIYASNGSEITINGGTFRSSTPKWTLNCKDKSDKTGEEVAQSVITVKGGSFYKFDPSNAEVGEGEVVVPDGYKVVKNGDWYTVYKEHTITVKEAEGGKVIVREVPTSSEVKEIDKAVYGETVEIVVEPAEGYKFKGISGVDDLKDVAEYAYQFTMPDKDVVLTPVFEKLTTEAEVPSEVANKEEVEEMLLKTLEELAKDPDVAAKIEGKDIEVEVKVNSVDKTITDSEKSDIEKGAAGKVEGLKVASYLDITIVVKDAKTNTDLTTIPEVKETITFTVGVPEGLPEVAEGYTRVFYIIRNHKGTIDVFEAKEADGKLSFESDKFSTYAIAYKDVENSAEGGNEVEPEAKPTTPDVPKTGDNIVIYAVLAVVAMAGMVVTIKVRKRK